MSKFVTCYILKEVEEYTDGFPPSSAIEFFAWVDSIKNKIPSEHLAKAQIQFGYSRGYYDSVETTVSVFYIREETAKEKAERILEENKLAYIRKERERAEYLRLKNIFGEK